MEQPWWPESLEKLTQIKNNIGLVHKIRVSQNLWMNGLIKLPALFSHEWLYNFFPPESPSVPYTAFFPTEKVLITAKQQAQHIPILTGHLACGSSVNKRYRLSTSCVAASQPLTIFDTIIWNMFWHQTQVKIWCKWLRTMWSSVDSNIERLTDLQSNPIRAKTYPLQKRGVY